MKGKKMVIAGLVMGMAIGGSVQSFAEPLVRLVEARIHPDYHITFDGEKKEMAEGYEILIYQDRTYVPVRYIAEELGATVNWHEDTKEIEIVKPEIPTTTGGAIVPPEEKPEYDYKEFPVTKETESYKVTAFMYGKDTKNGDLKVWFRVTNKTDDKLQLDQSATVVKENGKTYTMNTTRAADYDKRWYADIPKDETVEGFILLPDKIVEPENLHMELTLRSTDRLGKQSLIVETFDIAL